MRLRAMNNILEKSLVSQNSKWLNEVLQINKNLEEIHSNTNAHEENNIESSLTSFTTSKSFNTNASSKINLPKSGTTNRTKSSKKKSRKNELESSSFMTNQTNKTKSSRFTITRFDDIETIIPDSESLFTENNKSVLTQLDDDNESEYSSKKNYYPNSPSNFQFVANLLFIYQYILLLVKNYCRQEPSRVTTICILSVRYSLVLF